MHLIDVLAAGVRGAEGGSATLLVRGTSTAATRYASFEGTGANSSGTAVTLDANGGAEVYVDQVVDVSVYDSEGELVREFTAGVSAPAVEVRSASFTGTHYQSGASEAGNPTTLQAVLDLWLGSAGATNFQVQAGGLTQSISEAIGGASGLFFNVKTYGAVGDGVEDDTVAITDAMTDAEAADGGLVLFPPGTYRTTAILTVPETVSLIGVGGGQSIISLDHASAGLIDFSDGASTVRRTCAGLTLKAGQSNNAASPITVGGYGARFTNCIFSCANLTGSPIVIVASGTIAEFYSCDFTGMTGAIINATGAQTQVRIRDCNFTWGSTNAVYGIGAAGFLRIDNSTFNLASVTALSGGVVNIADTEDVAVVGCTFTSAGGSVIAIDAAANFAGMCHESGCKFGTNVVPYDFPTPSTAATVTLASRKALRREITDNSATVNLNTAVEVMSQETLVVKRTTNADQTVSLTNDRPQGTELNLIIWNESGGNIANETVTVGGSLSYTFALNNNLAAIVRIVYTRIEATAVSAVVYSAPYNIGDPP